MDVPTRTGGNASGTWGIDITGNAATATSADNIDGRAFSNTGSNSGVNADTLASNGISYYTSGVVNFSGNSTDGALYSQAYSSDWQHQIAGDYREGNIAVRGKNSGTWARWKSIPTIAISDTAPANETPGDMWWESDTGKLKIYYNDGSSSQWVDAVPIPDLTTYYSKAGGAISGPVTVNSSLTTTGIIYADAGITLAQNTVAGSTSVSPGLLITNSDIRSAASSTWTGDPGTQGKIQYHSNRWYIVADSSSDRIVQFRRNASDVSYVDNSGNYVGNVTGNVSGSSASITGTSTAAIPSSALGSGTANSTTYLRGDRTWQTVSAGATLSDDTSTNSNGYYPAMATATSGSWTTAYVSSTKLYFNPSTGTLNATVFNSLSDQTLKDNIQVIDNSQDILEKIHGVSFNWRDSGQRSYGVIAQEIEQVLPDIVSTRETGEKSVNYSALTAFLIEQVKHQQQQIDLLIDRLAKLGV